MDLKIVKLPPELFLQFQNFVEEVKSCGEIDPEPPTVPETVYWGILGEQVVGRTSLCHRIEVNLTKTGGHIGYEIHPTISWKRGK